MIKHNNILTSLALVITAFVVSSCTSSINSPKSNYDIGTNIDDVIIKQKDNGSFLHMKITVFGMKMNIVSVFITMMKIGKLIVTRFQMNVLVVMKN